MSPLHGLVGVYWSTHQSSYILTHKYHMFLDLAQWQEDLGRWTWRHLLDFLREVPSMHSRYDPRMHLFRSFLVNLGTSLQWDSSVSHVG